MRNYPIIESISIGIIDIVFAFLFFISTINYDLILVGGVLGIIEGILYAIFTLKSKEKKFIS